MYISRNKPKFILADETLTFTRYAPTSLSVVDGLRVRAPDDVIRFTCTGSVQPMSGRDLQMAPEGERETGGLNVWVWHDDCEMLPLAGDTVMRDGQYLVTNAQDWGAYTLCRLTRDDANVINHGQF